MRKNNPKGNTLDNALTLANKSLDLINAAKDTRKVGETITVLEKINHPSAAIAKQMILSTCRIMHKK